MHTHLTAKFTLFLIPSLVVILGVSGFYNYYATERSLESSLQSKADSKLASLVSITAYYLQNFETDLVNEMVATVGAEDDVRYLAVRNSDGSVEYGEVSESDDVRVFSQPLPGEEGGKMVMEIGLETADFRAAMQEILIINLALPLVVILVLALAILRFFRKKLITPINSINDAVEEMRSGDLSVRIVVDSNDEFGVLSNHFNEMTESLSRLVNSIKKTGMQIKCSAEKVAGVSVEINASAKGEERGSGQVIEASSDLLQTSEQVSQLAEKATELAERADEEARTGLQAARDNIGEMESAVEEVNQATIEMGELNQTAQSIHAIVDTIKSIAEQTNLLALNAAIEAARAGEQGRGFAVVADEVRTLAARTTASIGEISGIVNQLSEKMDGAASSLKTVVERVHSGQRQASISAESIQSITERISSSSQANTEIMHATGDQLDRISILRERLDGLMNSTRENAIKAGTTGDEGHQLSDTADEMIGLLDQFSVESTTESTADAQA